MVCKINRTSRVRLALEALESRDLFAGDLGGDHSSVWLLASTARDSDDSAPYAEVGAATPGAQSQASAPSSNGLLGGGLVNQPPAGTNATINLVGTSPYTFSAANFGFTDADSYSLSSTQTTDGPAAANVLVLFNTASAAGIEIANYYAGIHPGVHLLGINGIDPTNEDVSADTYLSTIRPQVMAALTPSIDVIVTTKGLPLRVQVTQPALTPGSTYVDGQGATRTVYAWKPFSSLESELARIDLISNWQSMGDQGNGDNPLWSNSYYQSNASFSYASFGSRLTARLDGYTVDDVENAIDRAQLAVIGPQNHTDGPFYVLVDNDPSKTYSGYMNNLVNQVLIPNGMPMVYDNTSAFVGTAPGPVIGYDSHGVHQASTPANYLLTGLDVTLADGAVFQSWESYNAYSFTTNNPHGNQGQVAQWLQIGGTVGVGNVEEPKASASTMTNENQMYKMLIAGRTFAEAAWSGTRQLSWVNTVVGDPLMRWRALVPGGNALAAVKISTLPTSGTLTNGGVAVAAGQFISVADINAGLFKFTPATGGGNASFAFQVQDTGIVTTGGGNLDLSANTITLASGTVAANVAGRHIFYNNSAFDGGSSLINASDDAAIAIDKTAYVPNGTTAIFQNITSYTKGINGIMVDLAGSGTHGAIGAGDFVFKVGNDNTPADWAAAPAPSSIVVRAGAGVGGSDRVEITWAANAIKNTWLEVQVLATVNTGLSTSDVFFWGNKVGDNGVTSATDFSTVVAQDLNDMFAHLGGNAGITNVWDINRSNSVTVSVDGGDILSNLGSITRLNLSSGPFAPEGGSSDGDAGGDAGISSALAATAPSGNSSAPDPVSSISSAQSSDADSSNVRIAASFWQLSTESQRQSAQTRWEADQLIGAADPDDELLDLLVASRAVA